MSIRTVQKAFAGGEVTSEFWGRIDDQGYQMELASCRNFILLPHGPAANRPGTRYVSTCPVNDRTRLIPFTFSTTQTMVLEFGDRYIRFHTGGATLESSPGVPYQVTTPYLAADVFDIHYTQSADVLTLVHPNYPPKELRRGGALSWTLVDISFASTLAVPTGVAAAATGSGGTTYYYVVCGVDAGGGNRSLQSAPASVTNNLLVTGNFNTITWTASAGAVRYNVFKLANGIYGYIGQTPSTAGFIDDNITPDLGNTPPISNNPLGSSTNYPGAVAYYEQRRWFAGTLSQPQNFWATRAGTESDMTYSIPTRDDDAFAFRVAAREANTIRHLVPLNYMVLLTSAAEWRLTSVNTDAITPSSVSVKPQSYVGANNVQPVLANTNLVYAAARGGHAREMAFTQQLGFSGYISGDLSLRAPHLFDGFDIVDMAYQKAPFPFVWMVSSSGLLLGLTYIPEQKLGGWHRHDTDGDFESVCCVAEGAEDGVYVVVRRTINGATHRYVERFSSRAFATQADAYFVDCGATFTAGTPVTVISGADWLEGKTVAILADGAVHAPKVVTSGTFTLDFPASKIQFGLPIESDLETLPAAMLEVQGGQSHIKNINKAWIGVSRSGGIFAGPTFDKLREVKQRTVEPYGSPPVLRTDIVELSITPSWNRFGQVCVAQRAPLPLTITSLTLELEVGG